MDAPLPNMDTRARRPLSGRSAATATALAGSPSTWARDVRSGTVVVFTTTLLISSLLLFLVQPMVGKMILPLFGGTPAVWNTCMVFFQAMLLAGYAYVHLSLTYLGVRRQAIVHLVLLLIPLAVLPIAVAKGSAPPADANPTFWLLSRLFMSVGLPFFVVSTSAPLLQRWFAGTRHANAGDPYFLYAASNLGSLLALLAYPLVIETAFPLDAQAQLWTVGYTALMAMTAACAFFVWRSRSAVLAGAMEGAVSRTTTPEAVSRSRPSLRERVRWVALAFVPSSLMLGVTVHITTDLAPVPLLWVLPLAIYLLTFVLVFSRRPPIRHGGMVKLLPFALLPMALLTFLELRTAAWLLTPIHLFTFFAVAMVCHGELARRRPTAHHLTEFYLWLSVGGVLGGLFNAIVAPVVFSTVLEYPLAMVLACLMMPRRDPRTDQTRDRRMDLILPMLLAVLAAGIIFGLYAAGVTQGLYGRLLAFGVPAIICFSFKERPLRFGLGFAVLLLAASQYAQLNKGHVLHTQRNFFGIKIVKLEPGGRLRALMHGRTKHGLQSVDPARADEPLAYYHRTGPIGDVFKVVTRARPNARVAVIGLGVGAIAAYAEPGQRFTFYEIDPDVARIAADTRYFSFLDRCRAPCEVVLGDGRLMLAQGPDHQLDLIVLDAFSSDAIPAHLLTREALQLYLDKLADGGVLAFHVSNRYLDLEPVLGNLAARLGLVCIARADLKVTPEEQRDGKLASHYVALARRVEDLGGLAADPNWKHVPPDPAAPVWTDRYSNILSVFRWF